MSLSGNLEMQARVPAPGPRLASRQFLSVALLFAGYASYYFCRSDFSVAMPMLIDELHRHGFTNSVAMVRLGAVASFGVLAYAAGKLLLGGLGDLWGGRRSFITGLAGSIVFTLIFTLGGALPIFTVAWIGNRLVQSTGWAGLVKVCSKWFSYTSYGIIVGILSLSYLIGDAVARQCMGMLIQAGFGWRSLFYFAAGVAALILLANLLLLRESRASLGFPEPDVNPLNVFEDRPQDNNRGLRAFLRPLLTNRAFWIVCFLSLGTTIVREAFNTWTPTYLHQFFGFSQAEAAGRSAIFPAVGAISVLVAGWAGDRLGASGRSIILFLGLITTTVGLFALTAVAGGAQSNLPLILIGIVAFGLLGPYSYLGGAMALDFGGRQGGATSSGFIDGVGYLGGILAGDSVARLSVALGWRSVFAALAAVSAVSAVGAGALFVHQRREIAKKYAVLNRPFEQEQ
jgi:OPA family glycerol-3-phosphate transporter-like MFS transporter